MSKLIGYIMVLFLLFLGVSFSILNADKVMVHYYFGVRQLPLSLLLIMTFGFGLVLGLFFMGLSVIRLHSRNYRLRKKLKTAEKEINNLRTIPIKDEH